MISSSSPTNSDDSLYSYELNSNLTYSPVRVIHENDDEESVNINDNKKSVIIKIICLLITFFFLSGLLIGGDILSGISPPLNEFYYYTISEYPNCEDLRLDLWRLFTSSLCHKGILHFVTNIICLYIIGDILEKKIGYKYVLLNYIVGCIYGNIFNNIINPYTILVGCSGPIYSLFGSYFAMRYINIYNKPIEYNLKSIFYFFTFGLFELLGVLYYYNSRIAYYTHWISFLEGFFFSIVFMKTELVQRNICNIILGTIFFILSSAYMFYEYCYTWPMPINNPIDFNDDKLTCCYYKLIENKLC